MSDSWLDADLQGKEERLTRLRVVMTPYRRWWERRERRRDAEAARQEQRDLLDAELEALHEGIWSAWPELVARARAQSREEHRHGTPDRSH